MLTRSHRTISAKHVIFEKILRLIPMPPTPHSLISPNRLKHALHQLATVRYQRCALAGTFKIASNSRGSDQKSDQFARPFRPFISRALRFHAHQPAARKIEIQNYFRHSRLKIPQPKNFSRTNAQRDGIDRRTCYVAENQRAQTRRQIDRTVAPVTQNYTQLHTCPNDFYKFRPFRSAKVTFQSSITTLISPHFPCL